MGKDMARIENGIVVNLEWFSIQTPESEELVDICDRSVTIGDTYENGKFYRDGEELLTPLDEARKTIAEMQEAYERGVNSIV